MILAAEPVVSGGDVAAGPDVGDRGRVKPVARPSLVPGERPVFLGVKLPVALATRLDAEARRRGVKKAIVVREALEALLGHPDASGRRKEARRGRKA